jgi:hypothetical protein
LAHHTESFKLKNFYQGPVINRRYFAATHLITLQSSAQQPRAVVEARYHRGERSLLLP